MTVRFTSADAGFLADSNADAIRGWASRFGVSKHGGWSPIDVIIVALTQTLFESVGGFRGLTIESAMRVSVTAPDYIDRVLSDLSGPDIWLAAVASHTADNSNEPMKLAWVCGGTLADIDRAIGIDQKANAHIARRMFVVNISACVREVQKRAQRERIRFPLHLAS